MNVNLIEEIINLASLAKMTKCDVILIKDGLLLGTDDEFSYIAKIEVSSSRTYAFTLKNITDFINDKSFRIEDCIIDGDKLCNLRTGEMVSIYFSVFDIRISDMYNNLLDTKRYGISEERFDDLRQDPKFEEALSLKSTEGIYKYYVDNRYLTTLFNGFLPVNKPDKVSVIINNRADHLFLADFIIYKAKNVVINIMAYYMKM